MLIKTRNKKIKAISIKKADIEGIYEDPCY